MKSSSCIYNHEINEKIESGMYLLKHLIIFINSTYDVKIIVSGFSTCKYINDINKTESSPWDNGLLCIIP